MSDQKSKGKKRSKAFYVQGGGSANKRGRRETFIDVGMMGFILTCNRGEQPCIREAHCLLGEYADKLYGPEKMDAGDVECSDNESNSDPDDIEASLKKEVAQIKQKRAQKQTRFEAVNSGAKNVVFMRTKTLPNPTELVHHLLTDIATTQTSKSTHIIRMLPVNLTCRATTEDISKHVPEFVHPYFHAEGVEPTTFAVKIKIRNNNAVQRDEVIKLIAGIVMGKEIEHKVHLDDPELAVIVEIIRNVCCLSVVKDFNKLKRYNLHEVVCNGGTAVPGRSAKKASPKKEADQDTLNADESVPQTDSVKDVSGS
ncbi:THUMP domain-containing protein 1-like [Asterias amurensis]|uniref:THUMP domain-containing protein 1-like n=1 Tax=Asterias amurensis TaxID=7602 RepID=UPI003AB2C575